MALMMKFRTQREALAAAREDLEEGQETYVLVRNGGTITVRRHNGRITHQRTPGWITCGMWIDPQDVPCIVS